MFRHQQLFQPDRFKSLIQVAFLAMLLVASVPASAQSTDPWENPEADDSTLAENENDPLELPNRFIFAFNQALDVAILKPVSALYRFVIPEPARDSVRNALRNLSTPVILANDLLQGEWERAGDTSMRFLINSTVGVAGLFDVAADWGYPYHDEDFGQTLGAHGLGEGFYLVLPLFGPSSLRDGTGRVVDIFLDPLTYIGQSEDLEDVLLARTAVTGVDTRSRNIEILEDLERDSIDYYARVRSLYRQLRAKEIANGRSTGGPNPDLYEFEFEDEPDSSQ